MNPGESQPSTRDRFTALSHHWRQVIATRMPDLLAAAHADADEATVNTAIRQVCEAGREGQLQAELDYHDALQNALTTP